MYIVKYEFSRCRIEASFLERNGDAGAAEEITIISFADGDGFNRVAKWKRK